MAEYQQYRAPASNDTALVDPPWPEQIAQLTDPPETAALSIGGVSLAELKRSARTGLLAAAREYTAAYADLEVPSDAPIVLSGHQPELFHPGVWFKNFALDALAKVSGGVGVHLIVDSDLCRTASIRTPTGSIDSPRLESVPYDLALAAAPYEERLIADERVFQTFADRAAHAIGPQIDQPLAPRLWSYAQAAQERSANLGRVLSEARHRLEIEWGSRTLEAPASLVADTPEFRRFAAELLPRSDATAASYNAALKEYRVAHRLRSAAQPLPDLAVEESWAESPLWVWFENEPTRSALWVKREGDRLLLGNRRGWQAEGPVDPDGVVAWFEELRAAGVKIRSRALTTTLYGRLVLSDLFLHGIGGAKYDQVTDRICQQLFGVTPPRHATLTATLRLPIEHTARTVTDRRRLLKHLRDLRYHPEHHLPADAPDPAKQLASSKREWIARTGADPAERHAAITSANQSLYEALSAEAESTKREVETLDAGLRNAAILDSREHSFCLFPADNLRERLQRLSRPAEASTDA